MKETQEINLYSMLNRVCQRCHGNSKGVEKAHTVTQESVCVMEDIIKVCTQSLEGAWGLAWECMEVASQ